MSEKFEDAQVIELQRVGVLHKNSVRLLALLAFAYLAYLAVANWRMRVFMGTQASEAGCQLSYSTARTLIPGRFLAEGLRLTECDGGSWSLRASRARAEVALWSLLSGPPQVERLQLRADSVEMFELKVDGELLINAEHLTLGGKPSLASAMLTMREGAIRHGDRVLQLPRGASIELTTERRTHTLQAKLRADEVIAVLNGDRRARTGKLTADARLPSASVEAPVPLADITLHVAELGWLAQDMTSIAPLSCTFQLLAVNPRLRQVEVGNGLVETTVQAASQPLGIELHVDKLLMTPSEAALRGRVALDGEDTLGLLDLADLPESLRLAFSDLEGAPFELRSQLSYELGSLDLHDIELRAGTATLKGHLALSRESRQGQLLLSYHGMSLGAELREQDSRIVFEPPPTWLRRR